MLCPGTVSPALWTLWTLASGQLIPMMRAAHLELVPMMRAVYLDLVPMMRAVSTWSWSPQWELFSWIGPYDKSCVAGVGVPDGKTGSCLDPWLPRNGLQERGGKGLGLPSSVKKSHLEPSRDGEKVRRTEKNTFWTWWKIISSQQNDLRRKGDL